MPHRRTIMAGIAALPFAGSAARAYAQQLAGDTVPSANGEITIHPVGHASLMLGWGPHLFAFDPAKQDFGGLPAPTAVFVTHAHGDHYDPDNLAKVAGSAPIVTTEEVFGKLPQALKAQAKVMTNGDTATVDGVAVNAIAAYNTTPERQSYHPQGVGNGYVLQLWDKKIYVAGDTEDTPEMRALTGISVAFLPMNLPYTMDVAQAAEAVKAFKPAIVYPYHYRGSDVAQFKALVGDAAEVRLVDWYKGA